MKNCQISLLNPNLIDDLARIGLAADEKFKKQKNGNVHRYVYYSCTRSRNLHCKGGAIHEEDLIVQLVKLMDQIDMNELGVKKKFEEEIERYKHFKRAMFGVDKIEEKIRKETDDIDFKTYVKYLLKEGSITEKRELLINLKSWLVLKNKQIVIERK